MNYKDDIVLENERAHLGPLKIEHLEALLPIALEYPDLLKHSPSAFGTEEALALYISDAIAQRKNSSQYPFVIYDKEISAVVGSTSFGNISEVNRRLEIGWTWLNPLVQGTGLNKHIKYLMLEFVFNTLEYERVELKADARNIQSRKAMEKIGAKYEGLLRSHTLMQDGHRRDTVYCEMNGLIL